VGTRWTTLNPESTKDWAELVNVLGVVDGTEEFYEPADLVEELTEPGVDPARDTVAVWDGEKLVGFGQLRVRDGLTEGRVRAWLGGGVRPEYRGQGIGRRIMDLLEPRAQQVAADRHPGTPVLLSCGGGLDGDPVRPLLEHRGYQLVRYFHLMQRDLPGAVLPAPAAATEPYRPEFAEGLRIAHNDAFSTHFGSSPQSPTEWQSGLESRTFRPDCSVVARAEDGTIESYVMAYRYSDAELYIGRVGTIQAARGRGLARACLLAALHAGIAAGYTDTKLDVDSLNPTGAGALYESVGYRRRKTFAAYDKVLPSLAA
jgi:ribosomal protein S18 acetylase RimI-like enzyme